VVVKAHPAVTSARPAKAALGIPERPQGPSLSGRTAASHPDPNVLTPASPATTGPRTLMAMADYDDPFFRANVAAITGGVVDYFDARYDTPSPALLASYDCVYTRPNFY